MARLARFVLPLLVLLAGCQSPGDKTTPAAEGTSVAPPREPRDVHGGLIGKTLGGCRVEIDCVARRRDPRPTYARHDPDAERH